MKRLFALLLAFSLILGSFPVQSFAEDETEPTVTTEPVDIPDEEPVAIELPSDETTSADDSAEENISVEEPTEETISTEPLIEEPVTETIPVIITGIALAALPSKTAYQVGEALDLTGGTISVAYSDGTTQAIDMTTEMISGFNNTITSTQTLTLTYEGFEICFDVTVNPEPAIETVETIPVDAAVANGVSWISLEVAPTKIQYVVNQDELDVSGGQIMIHYTDGTTEIIDITADMITNFDNTYVHTYYLTVQYGEDTTSYRIAVVESEDKPVVMRSNLDMGDSKLVYYLNEPLELGGAVLTLEYSDRTVETVTVTPEMIRNFNTETIGNYKWAYVSYNNNSYGFSYSVVSADLLGGSCGSNATWELSEDGVLTISGSGSVTERPWYDYRTMVSSVVVEEGITSLFSSIFSHHDRLVSATLPGTLTALAPYSFYQCTRLEEINLPDSLTTIDYQAFRDCSSLTTVSLPQSLTTLGNNVFSGCTSLTTVTLPDNLLTIEYRAFSGCTSLTTVTLPDNLLTIGDSAFYDCTALTEITFPESLGEINQQAFYNCSGLTEIVLPKYLTSLRWEAFAGCTGLEKIVFEGSSSPSYGSDIFESVTATGYYPDTDHWQNSSFFDNCGGEIEWIATEAEETNPVNWIELTTTPSKIQYVQNQDKLDVSGGVITVHYMDGTMETVEVTPDMVSDFQNTSVGTYRLRVWYQGYSTEYRIAVVESADQPLVMRSEVDPGNSRQIYYVDDTLRLDGAVLILEYSDGTVQNIPITRSMLPNFHTSTTGSYGTSVHYKGETYYGFNYIVVEEDELSGSCGDNAQWEINSNGRLYISGSGAVTSSPWRDYRDAIRSIEVGYEITELCDYAFAWCERLTDVRMYSYDLEQIGHQAFDGCSKLKSVSIPQNVTYIDSYAFRDCTSLTSVELPENLTEIGGQAFYNCRSLTSVTFPQSLTDIIWEAFENCTGLTEIVFPKKLRYLSSRAFAGCTNLKKITFEGKESPSTGDEIFAGVTATGYYPGTAHWNDWFFKDCGGEIEWIATGETVDSIRFYEDYLECYVSGEGVGWILSVTGNPGYLGIDCEFYVDSDVIQLGETSSTYCNFFALKSGTATVIAIDKRSGCTATATVVVKEPKEIFCGYEESLVTDDGSIEAYYAFTPEETGTYILSSTCNDRFVMEGPPFSVSSGEDDWVAPDQWNYDHGDRATYSLQAGTTYYIHFYLTVGFGDPGMTINLQTTFRLDKAAEVTGIEIIDDYTVYGAVGKEFYCSTPVVKIMPENAMGEITWESSNPSIISVYKEYIYTNMLVQGEGTVVLTAKCGDFTDSIVVKTRKPEKLLLNTPKTVSQTEQWYSFTPAETGRYAIISESTGEEPLYISVNGKYYPEDSEWVSSAAKHVQFGTFTAGVTYYLCAYNEGSWVASPTTVTITKAETKPVAMEVFCSYSYGNSMTFAVDFVPGNSYDKIISWESSNPDILDGDSYYYGANHSFNVYGSGEVTITAVSEQGLRASCTVTVGQCDNGHTYNRWRQTKAKTCTTDGQEMGTCICGLRTYRQVPASHDFVKGVCVGCGTHGGTCGKTVTWTLNADGILTISGIGAMDPISFNSVSGQPLQPWQQWQDDIRSVVIDSGVTGIVNYAFSHCDNLETVVISDTVTSLEAGAFQSCSGLKEIQVAEGNPNYCSVDGVLYSKDMSVLVKYPACRTGTKYTVPDTVTELEPQSFEYASQIIHIELPDNITALGTDTFADCISLKNIRLPKNLTDMEASCIFWNCSSLESIEIPDNVQVIGSSAFAGCASLKQIVLPSGLQMIDGLAFARCESLEMITIPAGVNSLAYNVFDSSSLKEIVFEGDAPQFNENTFCAVTATAYYPESNKTWTSDVMQNYGGHITWDPYGAVENRVILNATDLAGQTSVWIDGVEYAVQFRGIDCYVDLPDGNARTMITYTYNSSHQTRYPVGMKVWMLENTDGFYTVNRQEVFDDLLQYSGMSIRVTGKKGIRMITAIEQSKKNALTADGLAGYTLKEYGTAIAWASLVNSSNPLVLGKSHVKSNYAYKKGVADPVFAYAGNLMQYTNVIVNFSNEQCKNDIALRPYMILEDSDGNEITIYGGIVNRSIGYIAYQNRDVFEPQTQEYNYIWDIIRYVYGDIDADDFIHSWTPSIK